MSPFQEWPFWLSYVNSSSSVVLYFSSLFMSSIAQFCSLSHVWLFVTPLSHRLPCPSPGFPVHHQLQKLAQTHVCRVGDAIQPSHPQLSPSPPAFSLSQHQGVFQWVSSSHQVAKVLQLQSFQWIFRTDFLYNWMVWSKSLLQHYSSKASVLHC